MRVEGKKRYTAEDIRASYDSVKAQEELYGEWVAHYVYRPLSFLVTPFFIHLGFSPSRVTLISLLLAFSLPFVAYSFPVSYIFVGLIAIVISVFDCVDGNIARVTGKTSKSGHYFDFLTDILHRVFLYLAIGILITMASDNSTIFTTIATESLLIAALLAIIARMCRVYANSELILPDVSDEELKEVEETSGSWLDRFFFPFFSGLDWALPFAVLVFGAFGLLHWILVWLLFYSLLDFSHTQYSLFTKLR
jgi:hypothetical protein